MSPAVGELALEPGWPSMFRGYLGRDDLTSQAMHDGCYVTGDIGKLDGASGKGSSS